MPSPLQTLPELPGLTDVSLLGSGGFADVYRGRDETLGRWVAAKVFRVALNDAGAADQFRAECKILIRLEEHPAVLRVHQAGLLRDKRPYLYTELCDSSLLELIKHRGGRLSPSEATDLGHKIATALVAMHFEDVLHGDVSPQNILLRRSGAPVLADFGLAVLRDYLGNTTSGFNPAHAAPEAVRGDAAFTQQSDVYGLGSTLYTALAGQPPFPARPGEKDIEHSRRILVEPAPSLSGAGVPGWLADLIAAMLAKDPGKRPDMTSVVDVLNNGGKTSVPTAPPQVITQPPPLTPQMNRPGQVTFVPAAVPKQPPVYPPPPAPVNMAPQAYAPPVPDAPVRQAPYAPTYQEPAGIGAESQAHTRNRAGAVPAAVSPVVADQTRLRAGRPVPEVDQRAATPWWQRRSVQVAAGVGAIAIFGGGAAIAFAGESGAPPAAATTDRPGGAPGVPTVRIELSAPEAAAGNVTLRWSAPQTLDYAVVMAADGAAPTVKLARRATTFTAPIQESSKYCFQIQGTDGHGGVFESNVQSLNGAICRFEK